MALGEMDGSESDMHLSEDELKSVYGSEDKGQHIPWVRKRYQSLILKHILKIQYFRLVRLLQVLIGSERL